ncbi:hypothetical protein D3C87_1649170 [compost metagenome]
MQVVPVHARAGFGIGAEQVLQLAEQVVLLAEVAEVHIAGALGLGHLDLHLGAVVAVEAVAFDNHRLHALAAEDVLEGTGHRRGTGARGAGDGDNGITF